MRFVHEVQFLQVIHLEVSLSEGFGQDVYKAQNMLFTYDGALR